MFAVIARQPLLGPQVLEADCFAFCQRMLPADDEIKIFGEKRPGIKPVPIAAKFRSDAEFSLALLQVFADFFAVAAQEAKFEPVELPLDLVEKRHQDRQIDRMAERNSQRADFSALERRRQHARAAGGVVTLLQQRVHPKPEFGQLRCRPLAPEQVTAQFGLELLDRARQ